MHFSARVQNLLLVSLVWLETFLADALNLNPPDMFISANTKIKKNPIHSTVRFVLLLLLLVASRWDFEMGRFIVGYIRRDKCDLP